jgi:alpha-ribazole phosphatase
MIHLFLIRHGETEWTAEKRYQGRTDIPLSLIGKKQARDVAKRLKALSIDAIYSSPLKRASESAQIVSSINNKKVTHLSGLRELSFGKWEGKTAAELIQMKDAKFLKWSRANWVTPPGGESLAAFRKRIKAAMSEIIRKNKGKRVAIVSHGGAIKMMIFEALKLPLRSLWSFRIDPASISLLTIAPDFAQLTFLNDRTHLSA